MRRMAVILGLLLIPTLSSAQGYIHYYPPVGGAGASWDGGAFTDPAEGPDGCTNPAYGFGATDTDAGFCLSAANSLSIQTSASGNSRSYINANTLGIGLNYINSSGETTAFTLLETNATFHFTDATVLNITDALGTGFISAQGSGAAVARTITNTDGCLTVQNGEGGSANPILNVDTNCVPTFSSGTADPPATCTPPELYYETDTFELSLCSNTDTWEFIITMNAQTDDATVVGSGTGFALKVIPDCDAANNRLNYDTTTNAWSCATDDITLAGITAASGASVLLGRGSAGGAGDFQEITLGSGLTMTSQSLSASGSGGQSATSWQFFDDLCGGLTSTGNAGETGLTFAALVSGTISQTDFFNANPCVLAINDTASDNSGGSFYIATAFLTTTFVSGHDWSFDAVGSPNGNATLGIFAGLQTTGDPDAQTGAIWIRYDTDKSDATFMFQICDSNAADGCDAAGDDTNSNVAASTITPSASAAVFYRFRIRRAASGVGGNPTIYFRVNDETEVTFCSSGCTETLANLPGTSLYPMFGWVNRTNSGTLEAYLDYMAMSATVARY